METITLGAGCFWCVEAVFQQLNGVVKVESGYAGGHITNPTYEQICTKTTGHVEVVQVTYDNTIVSLEEVLEVYWLTHDPTTLNQQGADVGPQYRSVIFYHNETQQKIAEDIKLLIDSSGAYTKPIVTTIEAFNNYYTAELYHQNYYENNSNQSYCYYVVKPKMDKFRKIFAHLAKN
jgi:peptide-methionine (S)-S-oxide reductase